MCLWFCVCMDGWMYFFLWVFISVNLPHSSRKETRWPFNLYSSLLLREKIKTNCSLCIVITSSLITSLFLISAPSSCIMMSKIESSDAWEGLAGKETRVLMAKEPAWVTWHSRSLVWKAEQEFSEAAMHRSRICSLRQQRAEKETENVSFFGLQWPLMEIAREIRFVVY